MKKIIYAFLLLLIITGCSLNEEKIGWFIKDLPKYEGSGEIKTIVNKGVVKVKNLTETDKEEYIQKVKNEYSSIIVDDGTIYQAVNKAGKMIKIEYDKKDKELKISKEDY